MQRLNPRRALTAIIVVAVAARLLFILFFSSTLILEASGYDVYAVNLLAGNGYTRMADMRPDSDLPPLYSFVLAGSYAVFGRSAIPVALLQIGMDVVSWLAIYAIGRRVGGAWVGVLAVGFTAYYPYLLFQNLSINDTAIFIMLLTSGIWAAMVAQEKPPSASWRWAALSGLLLGIGALTKTVAVLALPLLGLWWWSRLGFRRAVPLTVVLGMCFLAPILPWMIRNTQLHGQIVFTSLNDGSNLYQGNNPCVADLLWNGYDAQWSHCMLPEPDGMTETQLAAWNREQAITYLRENPDQWLRLFAVKLWTQWSPELLPRAVPTDTAAPKMINEAVMQYESPLFRAARVAHLIYFTPLWILGFFGMWRAARDGKPVTPLLAVLAAITIAYVIYHPSTRYRSPGDPFFFVFSAYAVVWLWARFKRVDTPAEVPSEALPV